MAWRRVRCLHFDSHRSDFRTVVGWQSTHFRSNLRKRSVPGDLNELLAADLVRPDRLEVNPMGDPKQRDCDLMRFAYIN